jgi:hypothetical protein
MVEGNSGKGDTYRPQTKAEKEQYDRNYECIFGKEKPKEKNDPPNRKVDDCPS